MITNPYPTSAWRYMMTLCYLLMLGAGLWSLQVQPYASHDFFPDWLALVWSVSLILGGATSALGMFFRRTIPEFIGCWILGFGLGVYAVISWDMALNSGVSIARVIPLTSFAIMVLARSVLLWSTQNKMHRLIVNRSGAK